MKYYNLYQKRVGLKGTSFKEVAKNEMAETMNAEFESILGHTEGFLNFKEPFDVVLTTTTNALTRTALLRPKTTLQSGDYLTLEGETWIVRGVNSTRPSMTAELFLCNQTFNLAGVDEPIYCYNNSTTFGTKGVSDIGHFQELDSKTRLYFQRNSITEQIKIGHRLMFANEYLFKVSDINDLVYPGMYIVTCEVDSALDMDDFENNLAYNEGTTLPPAVEEDPILYLEITGASQIRKGFKTRYKVNSPIKGEWLLDDPSLGQLNVISDQEVEFIAGQRAGWAELCFATRSQQEPFTVSKAHVDIMIY